MKSLSKTITNYLIKKEIQDEKLKDETIYGLEMIISRIMFIYNNKIYIFI